ncbi:hypothetical protein J5U46_14205 [Micromonospora tulbaghiae]|uniref:Acetyltransferase n=1 Tax=Micromonospora tulbaghiae TaxID=479978 RepID=A0AAW4JJ07_9ACTN|nr:hypothetical protein [Micromonospora tulbaghiae]MBO4141305.1 hypothetical protein [Micromonospora tulbaghiae]MDX5457737.1 hypothetical protein [Micromonospora tulbaghiae]SCE88689.1 hypothetical protein GA0070562_3779 [Micromonospora tulbaghiae]
MPSDADELVRLRGLMLAGMSGVPTPPGRWQDVARDNPRASAAGRPLYRALGFRETADPAMRLTFPAEQSFMPLRKPGNDL